MRHLTYFISDLHLGASYIADRHAHERMIVSWLRSIAPTARTLYLLGDVLDYWYEYRNVVPRGYVRFLGALAELADAGVEVVWLKGNHDIWIFDYLPEEIGMKVHDGILLRDIGGKRFLMEHGDRCGEMRPAYRIMQRLFRNRLCQRMFSAIHPRWTVPFAHRWSSHSRLSGYTDPGSRLAESDPLVRFAEGYLAEGHHVDYFVFGHRHQLIDQPVGPCSRLIVLGDGFSLMTYGVFDGEDFTLHSLKDDAPK